MTAVRRLVVALLVALALFAVSGMFRLRAQTAASDLSLDPLLSYPFPANLMSSPVGATIAWTFNERGVRNIYVADGPDFKARRLTPYTEDDGQQLTHVSFAADGKTIVYVRGGDHDANFAAEGNLMPNPASSTVQARMQVWSIAAAGGAPKLLGEGDEPAIAPRGNRVAFVKDRRIWIAPLDGSKAAEQAFFARGSSGSPAWSPDGRTLAFVSDRDDHSFIGLFTDAGQPIRYLAPSTGRDSDPSWSITGREMAFVRRPGRGGVPQSPLVQQPSPWSIWVGGTRLPEPGRPRPEAFHTSWQSGTTLADSIPRIVGGVNLHWAADDRIVYLSYQDGWPHLYSIQHPGEAGQPMLLTPGPFMVEFATLTPDRRFIIYNANTGPDPHDVDRRHLYKVPVGAATPVALTTGRGIEWNPVVTGDGQTLAYISADAQRPPLPTVMPIGGGTPRLIAADRLPPQYPSAQLVTPEPVTFRGGDGLEIHGQLFKAPSEEARRAALVYVHGGPARQMLLGWHYRSYYANDYAANQYLASRGFIVLSVNYRLGIGYGHAFQYAERGGARGASEYLDVLAAGKYLQSRPDVDPTLVGIWGGSYGGYLVALALGRNSDVFAAGVDIHGVHDRLPAIEADQLARAMVGDGLTESDYKQALSVAFESSPISAVPTWRSPVLLVHADDDRNVPFHQTVDLKQRLVEKGVNVEELVIPDDIHDFLLFRTWKTVTAAVAQYFERVLLGRPQMSAP